MVLSGGMLVSSIGMVINAFMKKPLKWFRHINGLIIDVLASNHVRNLSQRGVSDICIGTKKILGSSLYFPKGRLLYQASLLVDCDLNLIERYLRYPSREPDYRDGRSHRDFLVTLRNAGAGISITKLKENLKEKYHADLRKVN